MIKKIGKRIVDIIILILLICVISLIFTGFKTGKPTVFGYRPYIVMTDSMVPTLPVHSFLIGVPVDAEDVQIGDIIVYSAGENNIISPSIIHRVIDITDEGFIFKGDHNEEADTPIKSDRIMYRIIYPSQI